MGSGGEDQFAVLRNAQPVFAPVVRDDELLVPTEQRLAGHFRGRQRRLAGCERLGHCVKTIMVITLIVNAS